MKKRSPKTPYFTWGCSDDLTFRLKKTLYCGEEDQYYDSSSSVALTDVAVSMLKESATRSKRKLSQRYATSLTRQLSISPCALMMSILYSERLRQLNPVYLEKVSSADLYVVSMLVATKFLHDEGEQEEIYNDEWAEAAGLAVSTVNRLEREFLDAIDWKIFVSPDEFLEFCSKVEARIAIKYGLERGWFSYTDLAQLLESNYHNILKGIMSKTIKVIGGLTLIYGMSFSLLASTMITYAAMSSASQQLRQSATAQYSLPTENYTSFTENIGNRLSPVIVDSVEGYNERPLTRNRQFTPYGYRPQLENFESRFNTTATSARETSGKKNETDLVLELDTTINSCHCITDCSRLCFEYPFRNTLRQTNFFIEYGTVSMDYCKTNYALSPTKFGRLDPKRFHQEKSIDSGFGILDKDLSHRLEFTTKGHKYMGLQPKVLGMVVM